MKIENAQWAGRCMAFTGDKTAKQGPTSEAPRRTQYEPNSATAYAERKQFETLRAEAARLGCSLHELAGGGFILGRWTMSRELPDLQAVRGLLRHMAGSRA